MRTCPLLSLLLLAACEREALPAPPGPPRTSGTVALKYPVTVVAQLDGAEDATGTPRSALLASAWDVRGQAVIARLREGALYRQLPELASPRLERSTQTLYFDPVVWREVRVASAQTGVDEGTLLGAAWLLKQDKKTTR